MTRESNAQKLNLSDADKRTPNQNEDNPSSVKTNNEQSRKVRGGMLCILTGYFIFLLGAKPALFGLDRSPVIGFVQTAIFLSGLGIICVGGYISIKLFWPKEGLSLTADFGIRLVWTGFVIALFCGMADVFGFGSHHLPGVPFFGFLQSAGVEMGEAVIAIGFVMMILPVGFCPDKTKDFHINMDEKREDKAKP